MNEYYKDSDKEIFTAGIDTEGEVWTTGAVKAADYNQYLEITAALLTDVYSQLDVTKEELQNDVLKIIEELKIIDLSH